MPSPDTPWWKDEDRESWRLRDERLAFMARYPQAITPFELPPTRWDVSRFDFHLRSWGFRRTGNPNYDLALCVDFSMEDAKWCPPEKVWRLAVCYSHRYPDSNEALVTVTNYGQLNKLHLGDDWNISTSIEIAGMSYPAFCCIPLQRSPAQGVDFARWGTMWFRARLAADKKGLSKIDNYGNPDKR